MDKKLFIPIIILGALCLFAGGFFLGNKVYNNDTFTPPANASKIPNDVEAIDPFESFVLDKCVLASEMDENAERTGNHAIGAIPKDGIVTILGYNKRWAYVRYNSLEGYIRIDFLAALPFEANKL